MEILDFNKEFEAMMQRKKLNAVVLLGHMNPDGDAAGCVMGLAHYIKINYPQYHVYPYLSDRLSKGPKRMIDTDRIFAPFTEPDTGNEPFAVITCDTATRARLIGRKYYEEAAASMVLDHHISNEGYGDINYTKDCEACAEVVFYTLDQKYLKKTIEEETYPTAADYIYMGILHDTSTFERAEDTTMNAASVLLKMGVDHKKLMETIQTLTVDDLLKRAELLLSTKRAMDGKIAYIFVDRKTSLEKNITYADIHPLSGIMRNCEDVKMAFTMFEERDNFWRCSFRSDGSWINVNEVLAPFGGGGHAASAGVRKETDDPKKLFEDLLERTAELRNGAE